QFVAHGEGPLRAGPYRKLAVGPFRYRGARLERCVRNEFDRIVGVEPMGGGRQRRFYGTLLVKAAWVGLACGILFEISEELLVGNLRRFFPPCLQGGDSAIGLRLRRPSYADKVAVANKRDGGHGFHPGIVERGERRAEPRRTQNLAKEHTRAAYVGRVLVAAGDKVTSVELRNRFAGDGPLRGRSDWVRRGKVLSQGFAASEFRVSKRTARRRVRDFGICGDEFVGRDAPLLGSGFDQKIAGSGSHPAQLRRHGRSGAAAESACVERGQRSVADNHTHAFERNAKLIGNRLRKLGADVLADFDLAAERSARSVLPYMQPRADLLRQFLGVKTARRRRSFLRSERRFRRGKDRNSRPEEL